MSNAYDLICIGGGIGGSALAATMSRRGFSVLVLEQSEVFEDRVRGEWIAPWGVLEVKRLGLYDLLMSAGGHHIGSHITYDESRDPAKAEAAVLPLSIFAEDVPGPLCIRHPHHCQTLSDEAARLGVEVERGVTVTAMEAGDSPSVRWTRRDGSQAQASARMVVGSDGRASMVRERLGITLNQDAPHHMFGGLLVDGVEGWSDQVQAIGTEDDFAFLAFPQGDGRVRVYGSYALDQRRRFVGPDKERAFLDQFTVRCAPGTERIAAGTPAGPLFAYHNNDSWTDRPFAEGAVLVGDAAGWNDPIVGLGLSITYRDVRLVSDLLSEAKDWSPATLEPYAEERRERMRRLRFAASITSALDAEFGEGPRERRRRYFERSEADPTLGMHAFAVMAGPESLPPEAFTPEHRARVLEG